MYTVVTKICIRDEPNLMIHGILNLDHDSTYYMLDKLQNGHVFYMYRIIF